METVTEFLKTLASSGVKLSAEAGQLSCYAPNGALTGDLKKGILKYKSQLLALLEKRQQAQADQSPSPKATEFPLSSGQKGLYILQKINPGMTAYNLPLCIRVSGDVDVRTLAKAWDGVLDQFPILTARVVDSEGTLCHSLDDACRTTIQHQAVSLDEQQFLPFLRQRAKQPFDLDRGPLNRIELFTIGERQHVLLIAVHHIIFDGVSAVVLLRSLLANYQTLSEGKPLSVPSERSGYQEFVSWEETMLASTEGRSHADYWQQQLSGDLPTLDLFPDVPRLASPSFEGATLVETLPADLSRAVREFARAHSILPSVVFLAAFKLLLHRYTNQDEIIVGMPVAVRPGQKFSAEIGYFINMVPLRTQCGGTLGLDEFLRRVQRTMLDGVYHASYPFELMLDNLRSRQGTKNAVFQVNFAYQNFISDNVFASLLPQQQGVSIQNVAEIGPEGYSDLGLEIFDKDASFSVHVRYNPDLYPEQAIQRFCEHYAALLKSLSEDGDRPLHEYSIVPEPEKRKLLVEFNDTAADYPKEKCIHELFAEQVALNPTRTAAAFGDEALTYGELYQKCCDLALYLQSLAVRPDSVVGLCVERSLDMMLGIMGTVQAGGAYLPLDPDYPDDRLTYMLQDSQAAIVLTQERFKDRVRSLVSEGTTILCLDTEWAEISNRVVALKAQGMELRPEVKPDNVCYVIYTSGSTGKPKGALIEHRALVNRIHWMQKRYQLGGRDVVLQKTPYSFDVSVWEFFWPMMAGASVVFAVPDGHKDVRYLESLIDRAKVTTLHFVPSMLRSFLDTAETGCSSVRQIFASGEALDKNSVDRYRTKFPNAVLHNLYGPTEAAIDVTSFDCSQLNYPFVPIGAPIDNIQLYILDPRNQPQPIGVPGELHIAGDGLARGYLNRPELTQEKFVANPFTPGTRMYKTGDLACWMEDGNIQYLGRIDTQVKIRGFRVEIGEIEARLNQFPQVQDSAVIAHGQDADRQLIAFYRATESTADHLVQLPNEELRAHLSQTLPEYMVPAAFVSVAAIPLSSNGKVDRRALSRMDVTLASGQEYVAPRNAAEKQLVAIWAEVLNLPVEKIGVNDNFFELGGHSLRAAQLLSKIRRELDVDVPLQAFFDKASVAQLARFVATAGKSDRPALTPVDRTQFERLPLSFAQERLWFINQLEPESTGYNLPGAVTIRGELDVQQLEKAFNVVIARHENLRTVFPSQDGQARQQILERVDFELERIDLSQYTDTTARDEEAKRICRADAVKPFDLANGPLLRGKVIKLAEHEHILMLNMHHIISDGWSIGILIKEIGAIMDGRSELPSLPIQYVDYAVRQRQWLEESGALEQQLGYWQKKLAGMPESLDLPTDYARPSVQSFAGATRTFALDAKRTAQLKRLAEQQGGTLYMALLAAFKVLLHRYTGQNDICVGSPIANRQYGETEGLIGMFVNTLALRSRVDGEETFAALLNQVKTTCLEAYEHQDAPFEKVVDAVRPQRNMAISPIFQVMLILQNVDMGTPDQRIQRHFLDTGISKFDLTFELTETADGLSGSIEYSTALYKPETIGRMVDHFIALCGAIATAPAAKIRDLDFLGEAEKHRLLVEYNATSADYPKNKCIHEFFEQQVTTDGSKAAVTFGDETLSYQELYDKSRALALYLQSQGVGPDSIVGLCLERSVEMMVGIMGTVLAGGAYMPLDPDYPDDRLTYMLQDSNAAVVLTQEKFTERIGALAGREAKVVALDTQWAEVAKSTGAVLRRDVQPHNLCYVIYTSGSTGRPKGVLNEHRALVNRLNWMQKSYPLSSSDVVLQKTPYSFDVSVWEFFWPMMTGASIVFAAPGGHKDVAYLEELINEAKVTTLHYVPSMLYSFLENAKAGCGSVRQIFASGEALDKKAVDRYQTTFPGAVLHNLYGPTEAAIDVTAFDCSKLDDPFVPIGTPIDNIQIHILDPHNRLQPIGVPGELHIAGDGLARGYLNRPELTEEKFVANPFVSGGRMYKTGDLARWMDDGNIQYLGRIDTQVKIRGFRIELGEIEARLGQHPQVQDAAVVARGQGADKHLVAFYTAKDGAQLPNEELRAHLLQTLPEYMVPAAFVSLPAIPLSSNGKVDRRALASLDVTMTTGREYVAPRTETEQQLVAIWAEVLNLAAEKIGVEDNFFELGGHSLLATQLISKIRTQMDVDLPLKALFERSSVAQLAEAVASAQKSAIPAIRPIDRAQFERLPLSFAQERLWFINQLEPESAGYNVPGAIVINGELDVDALDEAFNRIIERHESLRTVFRTVEGYPQQQILDRIDFRLQRIDLSGYDRDARDIKAKRLCQADATTPFDLANGPLLRGMVIKLDEHEHILMLNMHHIVSDGWSIGVLVRELSAILSGGAELAPLPIQYADYSVWQRRWLEEGGVLEQQLGYWQKKLAGLPESLDLATDYPRPSAQSFAGAAHAFTVDAQLTAQLKRLAEQQGGTLYMALLAAFKVLLHRYTGQSDICVGSPIANRQYGETESLIGMFVNTLALRSQVDGADSFAALFNQVKTTCLEAYEHQDAPFEKVVEAMCPQRNMAISPIFQMMLILQNVDMGIADPRIQRYPLETGISKFDLTFEFTETSEGLAGSIEYSTALYKPATIARMVEHFVGLCRAIAATPAAPVRSLDYLGEAEKHQLLVAFNDTRADYAKDKCLGELFAEQVALSPDRTAVVFGEQALTYQELYDKSRDVALYLQSQGVGPDSIVGLCMERSLEMVVGMMGTVLAGGAYMPLDPAYPDDRLTYMLEDSRAAVVLTQQAWSERIGSLAGRDANVIALDTDWAEIGKAQGELRRDVQPDHLCYVIYTSGSTGRPKGVVIPHRAICNHMFWMQSAFPIGPSDAVLQKTPFSFDASVWEFYAPLLTGGRLVVARPDGHRDAGYMAETIRNENITVLQCVPSQLRMLLDEPSFGLCTSLRRVFCGGEELTTDVTARFRALLDAQLVNLYGPTEAAIDATAFDCSQSNHPFVPIGRPIDNTRIYILDEHNQPQPVGVPGELHIAGDGLARGYLNRPELTQEKFVANPFTPGTRMYKTGDLARWIDDGTLQYLGRIDTQVKIRGFRIELGEIETRLGQHPAIQDGAVIARGKEADKQLIAFYRAKDTTADHIVQLPHDEVRAYLLETLPEYMVPAGFVSLAAIPLNSSGKVDRRALERIDVILAAGREYVAPRNATEQRLVAIWAEVLNRAPESIGVHDDFFELGGHSLLAVQLMAKTNRHFQQVLPLAVLFTASDIAAFAKLISGDAAPSFDIVVPIQPDGNALPVFAVPGVGGNVLSLRPLSRTLGDAQPFFALQAVGLDGKTPPLRSVEQTAETNIAAMKTVQPTGPYGLIGHSYGGVVAYEMARILVERGEEVSSLILLDSIAPSIVQRHSADDEVAELVAACKAIAALHGEQLEIDSERLRPMSDEEKIHELVGLLNDRGHAIDSEQFATFYGVYQANQRCYRGYTPSPLSRNIDVALYRATQGNPDRRNLPGDYGWEQLLQNPIRIADVDADHFSILEKAPIRGTDGALERAGIAGVLTTV
nr:condensation domain-containing protein [uncultured bacterium]